MIVQTSPHKSLILVKLLIVIQGYIDNADQVIDIGIFGTYGGTSEQQIDLKG